LALAGKAADDATAHGRGRRGRRQLSSALEAVSVALVFTAVLAIGGVGVVPGASASPSAAAGPKTVDLPAALVATYDHYTSDGSARCTDRAILIVAVPEHVVDVTGSVLQKGNGGVVSGMINQMWYEGPGFTNPITGYGPNYTVPKGEKGWFLGGGSGPAPCGDALSFWHNPRGFGVIPNDMVLVSGTVIDQSSNPVPGASVNIAGPDHVTTTTDSIGAFGAVVHKGTYTVTVSPPAVDAGMVVKAVSCVTGTAAGAECSGDTKDVGLKAGFQLTCPVCFTTPDVAVVRYIAKFTREDVKQCVLGLFPLIYARTSAVPPAVPDAGVTAAVAALGSAVALCAGLALSANPLPPSSVDSSTAGAFQSTKEYRGLVDIAPVTVYCDPDSTIFKIKPESPPIIANGGYTPLKVPSTSSKAPPTALHFGPAEPLRTPLNGASGSDFGRVYVNRSLNGGHTVLISYLISSRIATAERLVQYAATGYDAPFVWTVIQLRASCDGGPGGKPAAAVSVALSEFPSTFLYVDGKEVGSDGQSNLIPFIKDGGKIYNPSGTGNLALEPTCSTLNWGPGQLSGRAGSCLSNVVNGLTGGDDGSQL
jgi:hypothetical protein